LTTAAVAGRAGGRWEEELTGGAGMAAAGRGEGAAVVARGLLGRAGQGARQRLPPEWAGPRRREGEGELGRGERKRPCGPKVRKGRERKKISFPFSNNFPNSFSIRF